MPEVVMPDVAMPKVVMPEVLMPEALMPKALTQRVVTPRPAPPGITTLRVVTVRVATLGTEPLKDYAQRQDWHEPYHRMPLPDCAARRAKEDSTVQKCRSCSMLLKLLARVT
jgi:hypothetical protein